MTPPTPAYTHTLSYSTILFVHLTPYLYVIQYDTKIAHVYLILHVSVLVLNDGWAI